MKYTLFTFRLLILLFFNYHRLSKDDESTVFDFLLNLVQSPGWMNPKRKTELQSAITSADKPAPILTPADTENDVESDTCSPDHSDDCPRDEKDPETA